MKERTGKVKTNYTKAKKFCKELTLIRAKWIDAIVEDWDKLEHSMEYYFNENGDIKITFMFGGVVEDAEILDEMKDGLDEEKHARAFWDRCLANSRESYVPSGTSSHGNSIKTDFDGRGR